VPRLRRWHEALNDRLLPMFGSTAKGLEFDYESPVDDDADAENSERDSKVKAYVLLTGAGVTPAAASEVVGLPEMEHEEKQEPPAPGFGQPAGPPAPPAPPAAPEKLEEGPQDG
jgi:hypothetical protein